jgi:outer membrane protein assembly factor BamB
MDIRNVGKGYPRTIYLVGIPGGASAESKPPGGKVWLLLGGIIRHITSTTSTLKVYDDKIEWATQDGAIFSRIIDTAIANGSYPIFPLAAEAGSTAEQWHPIFIHNGKIILTTGDNNITAVISVLEFDS